MSGRDQTVFKAPCGRSAAGVRAPMLTSAMLTSLAGPPPEILNVLRKAAPDGGDAAGPVPSAARVDLGMKL